MRLIPKTIPFTTINHPLVSGKNINLAVARFDEIHPVISGNKLYKLLFFLATAAAQNIKTIVTIGGAYSNHLLATAYAGKENNLHTIGLVRGEEVAQNLSETLQQCRDLGMHLFFTDRITFADLDKAKAAGITGLALNDIIFIPEGGYGMPGAKGAANMLDEVLPKKPTHIILPVGTATTLAGIVSRELPDVEIIAVPVLKNLNDIPERIEYLLEGANFIMPEIWNEYHFGGYAKKTPELLSFMNELYMEQNLPTDFVYTAKMMFGIFDKIKNNYFKPGSRIIALHTGGLQGNRSLPAGTLHF